ncbi:MAG: SdpI family protein [Candidatus ainarchaeum sp.]|nr:SdpI family protein [Candidatus ainarchaeum sp.]
MSKTIWASVFVILLMMGVSGYLFFSLPDTLVSHWGMQNEPNGWMSKTLFFVFFIGLTIGLFLLLVCLPKTDPLKKNYAHFQKEYDLLVFFFTCFMFYVLLLSLLVNLGYGMDIGLGMTPALAVLFFIIGGLLEKTKRNYFVGIRTPWALNDDENWEKTHKFGGKLFRLLGIIIAITWLFAFFYRHLSDFLFIIVIAEILFAAFVPFAYSYLIYAKKQKPAKKHS